MSFDQFVNERYNSEDSKENKIDEVSTSPVSGTKAGWTYELDHKKYVLTKDVTGVRIGDYANVVLPKGTEIYNLPGGVFANHSSLKQKYTGGINFKQSRWDNTYGVLIRKEEHVLNQIEDNSKILESLDESIDSRVRSKIVVHLKNQGIEHGEDYDYSGGEFLAKDMDVAQNMADAVADKFRVVIYDDRITKDGKIPMMIVENETITTTQPTQIPEIPAANTQTHTVEKPVTKEDIKGFHKIDSIKRDIEKSKVALEKMKTLIDQGVKDKKLTESYIQLLEHRTTLIKEMDRIIEETKQTITKK